ncbi:MAG: hypothetical protein H6Q69_6 [Firmicutes bacterium]|nr:hypothetical protein [Bacillota bacterium]
MKAEKPMEDYGMELNEQVLTEEEQEELAQMCYSEIGIYCKTMPDLS